MKKPLIPFGWLPGHWGLAGEARELAKISYELTGEEHDRAVVDVKFRYDDKGREIQHLKLDYQYNKIEELEYEKKLATLQGEPWVRVKDSKYNANDGLGGFEIELDWNEHFVEYLADNGYTGANDTQIVGEWFEDICRSNFSDPEHVLDVGDVFGDLFGNSRADKFDVEGNPDKKEYR